MRGGGQRGHASKLWWWNPGLGLTFYMLKFKVAFLVRQSLSGQASLYLADDCCFVSDITRRSLESIDVPTCVVS